MTELRIGDAQREEAVHLLGEQYAEGRLTKDELDERTDAAWSARTQRELDPLFVDLPVRRRAEPVPPAYAGPQPPRLSRPNAWRGNGRWVVPVLAVLLVLTVLTHLPLVLFAVLVWVLLAKGGRWHGGHRQGGCGPRASRRW